MSDLLPVSISETISRVTQEAATTATSALSEELCNRWGIDRSQFDMKGMKSIGAVYQKLKDMKALLDLLRLSVLTPKLIATNRVTEKENKKTGETLWEAQSPHDRERRGILRSGWHN